MINMFAFLFSTIMTMYIVFRATALDRKLKWFAPIPEEKPAADDAEKSDAGREAQTTGMRFGARAAKPAEQDVATWRRGRR